MVIGRNPVCVYLQMRVNQGSASRWQVRPLSGLVLISMGCCTSLPSGSIYFADTTLAVKFRSQDISDSMALSLHHSIFMIISDNYPDCYCEIPKVEKKIVYSFILFLFASWRLCMRIFQPCHKKTRPAHYAESD